MSENENNGSAAPLEGWRILVSRAREQAGALSAGLRALGAEVYEIPFIEIRPPRSFKSLDESLKLAAEYEWLILTSVNGVRAMFDRMAQLNIPKRALAHLNIAAIGPATRAAIEREGLKVALTPREYVAEVDRRVALRQSPRQTRSALPRQDRPRRHSPRTAPPGSISGRGGSLRNGDSAGLASSNFVPCCAIRSAVPTSSPSPAPPP